MHVPHKQLCDILPDTMHMYLFTAPVRGQPPPLKKKHNLLLPLWLIWCFRDAYLQTNLHVEQTK